MSLGCGGGLAVSSCVFFVFHGGVQTVSVPVSISTARPALKIPTTATIATTAMTTNNDSDKKQTNDNNHDDYNGNGNDRCSSGVDRRAARGTRTCVPSQPKRGTLRSVFTVTTVTTVRATCQDGFRPLCIVCRLNSCLPLF